MGTNSAYTQRQTIKKAHLNYLKDKTMNYSTSRISKKMSMLPTLHSDVYRIVNKEYSGMKPGLSSSEKLLKKLNDKLNHYKSHK